MQYPELQSHQLCWRDVCLEVMQQSIQPHNKDYKRGLVARVQQYLTEHMKGQEGVRDLFAFIVEVPDALTRGAFESSIHTCFSRLLRVPIGRIEYLNVCGHLSIAIRKIIFHTNSETALISDADWARTEIIT